MTLFDLVIVSIYWLWFLVASLGVGLLLVKKNKPSVTKIGLSILLGVRVKSFSLK